MKQKRLYVAIDVDYWTDDKVIAVGLDGAVLFLQALGWSRKHLRDGFIPEHMTAVVGAAFGITAKRARAAVAKLTAEGMWTPVDGGYQVDPVKWAEWQMTRQEIEDDRARDRERKRAARQKKALRNGDGAQLTDESADDITSDSTAQVAERRGTSQRVGGGRVRSDSGRTPSGFHEESSPPRQDKTRQDKTEVSKPSPPPDAYHRDEPIRLIDAVRLPAVRGGGRGA